MFNCTDEQAVCRGCGRHLQGSPYFKGGRAYVPAENPRHAHDSRPAKVNYYGGWVCSRACDYRASLELERSMPGHGSGQTRLDGPALERINSNWPDEA